VKLALGGAKHVTGLDIRPSILEQAMAYAKKCNSDSICSFTTDLSGCFDIIISQDAFEHYENPETVIEAMKKYLSPQGEIWISFGPPWLHPKGSHLPSLFPWAHLVFSEKSLLRWRADFKSDGATVFSEIEGGLNKMTLARFKRIVKNSGLKVSYYNEIPIRAFAGFAACLPKEFITSVVIAKLKAN
jgi:SAM-dependent methyltransferase